MDIDLSTWMMIFFILLLTISIWKIYVFLPTEVLADDDRTPEATDKLRKIIQKIKKETPLISDTELFERIKSDVNFDKTKYWRFNMNRLKSLLTRLD